eukprot:UN06786
MTCGASPARTLPESSVGSVGSLEECEALCNEHDECLHITYYPINQRCYEYTNDVCTPLAASSETDAIFES